MIKIFQVIKGLLISEENTFTPKEIEIIPAGTADTKTTITSSQTVDRTVTIPDDTTTLLGTATAQSVSNKTITNSTIDSTPIGQTIPAAVSTTSLVATTADINGGTIDATVIGATTPAAGTFTNLAADTLNVNGDAVVTDDAVQTLKNKSLEDTTTAIIDAVDPTIKIKFDAAGTTATATTLLGSQTVDRTLTLPDITDTLVTKNSVDILTNKSLTNPDIDGGTIDSTIIGATTPAAATVTSLNATGDAVIGGDLTVNGTTVTLNTTNLNVEDKNITVNFGGNDVSAEGAGLTVDRTGTDGSLIYKDASATKFAAGALGSEVDLVGTTSTQTITNKTIQTSSLDSSPVGATTPSTGSFTTLDATSATVGGATVTTATNTQTLTNKTLAFLQQNSANDTTSGSTVTLPVPTTGIVRLTNAALVSISGITAGASGQSLILENKTGITISLLNEDAGATATNRVLTGTAATVTIANDATLFLTYDSTSARWQVVGGTGSGTGGSGFGGVNYITNGDAETTSPFVGYQYGSTAKPVVPGILGAAGFTATISSSDPLAGDNSFLLTKTVSSTIQGSSQDIPFTVDLAYRAKANTIEFDYRLVSGTFQVGTSTQDSELIIYIYDIDNNVMIEPSNYKFLSNSTTVSSKFSAQFQTSVNSVNYRLLFYNGTTNATQFVMKVDNIKVGPSEYVYGTPVTDWQSYTSITNGWGTITNSEFWYMRTGDSIFIRGRFVTGTVAASEARVGLPSGYTVDANKVGNANIVGQLNRHAAVTNVYPVLINDNNSYVQFGNLAGGLAVSPQNANNIASNSEIVAFFAGPIPITGLSSSVQMSDNADTRVVAASATNTTFVVSTGTAATTMPFTTIGLDTHGAATSAGVYTVPVAGVYDLSARAQIDSGGGSVTVFSNIRINGTTILSAAQASANTHHANARTLVSLKTGDLVTFSSHVDANSYTVSFSATIQRISGPSAIAASETVKIRATTSAGQSISNAAAPTIIFGTKTYDSHGTFNSSTGIFTAPVSGNYSVNASVRYASASFSATNFVTVQLFKNGVFYSALGLKTIDATVTSSQQVNGFDEIELIAGDTIDIRTAHNEATPRSLSTVAGTCFVSVKKVGL